MTADEQFKIIERYTKERHELMRRKGEDYNGADVLGLFKDVAKAGGRKPENVIIDEVHKKVLRLQNLMQGKEPNNESIIDSVTDLSNYADILRCALGEELERKVTRRSKTFEERAEIVRAILAELKRLPCRNIADIIEVDFHGDYRQYISKDVGFRVLYAKDKITLIAGTDENLIELFNTLSTIPT